MRRLLALVPLFALAVGCGPTKSTYQGASPPSDGYTNMQKPPRPTDGKTDPPKAPEGK